MVNEYLTGMASYNYNITIEDKDTYDETTNHKYWWDEMKWIKQEASNIPDSQQAR